MPPSAAGTAAASEAVAAAGVGDSGVARPGGDCWSQAAAEEAVRRCSAGAGRKRSDGMGDATPAPFPSLSSGPKRRRRRVLQLRPGWKGHTETEEAQEEKVGLQLCIAAGQQTTTGETSARTRPWW